MDVLDVKSLDWASLKTLYDKNLSLLHEKLLSGSSWEETENLRNLVTQLETAMDKTPTPCDWLSINTTPPKHSE